MAGENKAVKEAVKPASKAKSQSSIVKCKNISKRVVNTSKGCIQPGKSGECTVAELRQYHRYLE